MKRSILTVIAIASLGSWAWAAQWFTDYSQALSAAKAQNKPVLIDFTGSDWCGWCMKLDREVFSQTEFKNYADQNLVLLKVDFPRRKALPFYEQAQNQKLAIQFGVQGFPTVVILKPDGKKAGELGYVPGGPKAFISEMEKAAKVK